MHELKHDLKKLTVTKGSSAYNKHSALNVKNLDYSLANELKSPINNSYNKNYGFFYKEYNRKLMRLKSMELLQNRENQRMFSRRSGHHRM